MYDTKKSIQTIAFMNSISVLAPALGPLAGALILQWWPWQTIFYALAIWAIIPLLLLQWDMPETAPIKEHSLNLKEILGRYKRIALNHRFMIYLLASRTLFSAMIVWLSAGPFLLYDTYKMDSLHFGYAQIFVFGAFIVGTRANSFLMTRYDLHKILWQGWVLCLLGSSYSLIYALINSSNFYPILPGLMLVTFGSGISLPIYSRLAIEQSDEPMGSKVAMTTFSMTLFGVLATLSINLLFTNSLLSLALIMGSFILAGFMLFSISYYMKWLSNNS
jgi:DHA1 family multidrug/chloramphenicol efflux transport protein-like MFS transporter